MKRSGFTLAEVLITLTIIGVVAALTMPAIFTNISKSKIGPSLSRFVNAMETGMQNCMADTGNSKLTAVQDDAAVLDPDNMQPGVADPSGKSKANTISNDSLNILGRYILWSVPDSNYSHSAKYPNGTAFSNLNPTYPGLERIMKNGYYVHFLPDEGFSQIADFTGTPYTNIISIVEVDINGSKNPNVIGKDIFFFMLDEGGFLIPMGSSQFKKMFPSFAKYNCDLSKTDHWSAMFCAGAVADNGWVADYDS